MYTIITSNILKTDTECSIYLCSIYLGYKVVFEFFLDQIGFYTHRHMYISFIQGWFILIYYHTWTFLTNMRIFPDILGETKFWPKQCQSTTTSLTYESFLRFKKLLTRRFFSLHAIKHPLITPVVSIVFWI